MEQSEYIAKLIYRHLVGDLSEEEQKTLDDWIAANPSHRTLYERLLNEDYLKQQYNRRRAINYHRPMKAMKARILVERSDNKMTKALGGRKAMLSLIGVAAVVLLVFCSIRFIRLQEPQHPKKVLAQVESVEIQHGITQAILTTDAGDTLCLNKNVSEPKLAKVEGSEDIHVKSLATLRGGEFKVTLEDGTEVWLNAESRLIYPETFGEGDRRVEVEGEAYFKVAKDEMHPFYVETAGQLVRVVGTEFDIHSYPEDAEVTTTLVSGSIALKPAQSNGAELTLTPGHQSHFDKQSMAATVKTVDTEVVTSWRSGKFVFENQTFEQIMKTLSRWYDFDYRFSNEELSQMQFMGSVPRYGTFSEVLQILEASGGIKFRQKGKTILISKK